MIRIASRTRRLASKLVHETLGHPEEQIIAVDQGELAMDPRNWKVSEEYGGLCYLVATDVALYLYDPRRPDRPGRFTYDQIDVVSAQRSALSRSDDLFTFRSVTPTLMHGSRFHREHGEWYGFGRLSGSKGRLPRYVKEHARGRWDDTTRPRDSGPGPPSGDREPRRPGPTLSPVAQMLNEPEHN